MSAFGGFPAGTVTGTRHKSRSLPVYHRILQTLRTRIATGVYPLGSRFPTDAEICAEFQVSRHTVRSAVQYLVAEGLIERFPGRGTFVSARNPIAGRWAVQSLEDVLDRTFVAAITVLTSGPVMASDHPSAAAALRSASNDELYRIQLLRVAEGRPYASAAVYLPMVHARRLPADLAERVKAKRLLYIVEEFCDVRAIMVRQATTAVAAPPDVAEQLGLHTGDPLLSMRNTFLDADGEPIEYSEILCDPDRFEQVVELLGRR